MANQFEDESVIKARIIELGGSTDALYDNVQGVFNRTEALRRIRELEAHQLEKESVKLSKRALIVSWVAIGISVIALITSIALVLRDK